MGQSFTTLHQTLLGAKNVGFGGRVALSGDGLLLAVGQYSYTSGTDRTGAVFLFSRARLADSFPGPVQTLVGEPSSSFGTVALSPVGRTLAVGGDRVRRWCEQCHTACCQSEWKCLDARCCANESDLRPWRTMATPFLARGVRAHRLDGALLAFDPETGWQVRIQNSRTRMYQRTAPRVVMVGFSNACNLRCGFCSRDVAAESEWDVAAMVTLLRDLDARGVLEVAFGGGEPFAARDFVELVLQLREQTNLALHVTTNGTLLTNAMLERLCPPVGSHAFGIVRLSLYEDNHWQDTAALLCAYRQRWGGNLLVHRQNLAEVPETLRTLAMLGANDVSILSYVGDDPGMHLSSEEKQRLAEMLAQSPLAVRLSVCATGIPVPRLHVNAALDGVNDPMDCGAGRDFLSIGSDRSVRGCSFQAFGTVCRTADEILDVWRQSHRAPVLRRGCARNESRDIRRNAAIAANTEEAQPRDSVEFWQSFSGNNSGECLLVARFETVADAETFMAEVTPGFTPDGPYSSEWLDLFRREGVLEAAVPWAHSPYELLRVARAVYARGFGSEEEFRELHTLADRRGAKAASIAHAHQATVLFCARSKERPDVVVAKLREHHDLSLAEMRIEKWGHLILGVLEMGRLGEVPLRAKAASSLTRAESERIHDASRCQATIAFAALTQVLKNVEVAFHDEMPASEQLLDALKRDRPPEKRRLVVHARSVSPSEEDRREPEHRPSPLATYLPEDGFEHAANYAILARNKDRRAFRYARVRGDSAWRTRSRELQVWLSWSPIDSASRKKKVARPPLEDVVGWIGDAMQSEFGKACAVADHSTEYRPMLSLLSTEPVRTIRVAIATLTAHGQVATVWLSDPHRLAWAVADMVDALDAK